VATIYRLNRLREFLHALEQGASRESAAPLIGLSPERLSIILNIGKEQLRQHGAMRLESDAMIEADEGEPGRLYIYVLRSEARAEAELAAQLYRAATTGNSWKAAFILLSTRWPERWGKISKLDARKLPADEADVKRRPGLPHSTAELMRREVLGLGNK